MANSDFDSIRMGPLPPSNISLVKGTNCTLSPTCIPHPPPSHLLGRLDEGHHLALVQRQNVRVVRNLLLDHRIVQVLAQCLEEEPAMAIENIEPTVLTLPSRVITHLKLPFFGK